MLGQLIALTHYSMSSDETRPHLAGALFEGDGKTVRMVTTDGHRLSKAEDKQATAEAAQLQHARAEQGHRRAAPA